MSSNNPLRSPTSSIFVCNFEGELTSVVVERNPGLVTGLAVAPEIGMLYWSDDDGDAAEETLYQGRMDGTSIEQIKTFGKVKYCTSINHH